MPSNQGVVFIVVCLCGRMILKDMPLIISSHQSRFDSLSALENILLLIVKEGVTQHLILLQLVGSVITDAIDLRGSCLQLPIKIMCTSVSLKDSGIHLWFTDLEVVSALLALLLVIQSCS